MTEKQKIYTAGYSGKSLEWLDQKSAELGALIIDVRYSPNSRNPTWRESHLRNKLGTRYTHVKELGNENYRGSTIQIADWETGKKIIDHIDQPIILLCMCKDPEVCHRTTIAQMLRITGYEVEELDDNFISQGFLWKE